MSLTGKLGHTLALVIVVMVKTLTLWAMIDQIVFLLNLSIETKLFVSIQMISVKLHQLKIPGYLEKRPLKVIQGKRSKNSFFLLLQ